MKNPRFRTILATGIAAVLYTTASMPAHAQWTVFDPTNFSQNVLTAARELQQVNNQIHSLQNEATSLINEARNLASLPYSSLAQLEQSITQTQQLLAQAQRRRSNCSPRRSVLATTSPPSTRPSRGPIRRLIRPRPPRSSSSPMRRRAGRIRWTAIRTRCGCKPAWCRISTARAPRSMR